MVKHTATVPDSAVDISGHQAWWDPLVSGWLAGSLGMGHAGGTEFQGRAGDTLRVGMEGC